MDNCTPSISVIVSTYNSEEWLEKVLWGFHQQSYRDFEVVIADDGSGPRTKDLIGSMADTVFYKILHVWQEDEGFQKSKILNKALKACRAEYVIMTDGDCIPRKDFVEVHQFNKAAGHFISGGYFMLPMNISQIITKEDIEEQNCFNIKWLEAQGHNSSGWKVDILRINGFDERMQYGGQDRELGERLVNSGIKPIQLRYSAICVHLDHKRGYKTEASIHKNKFIRKEVKKKRSSWTDYGLIKK